jgi:hypothetical protein
VTHDIIAGVLIALAVLLLVAAALRTRKLRLDEIRDFDRRANWPRHPQPAPYEAAKRYRILENGEDVDTSHQTPQLPKINTEEDHVFHDGGSLGADEFPTESDRQVVQELWERPHSKSALWIVASGVMICAAIVVFFVH